MTDNVGDAAGDALRAILLFLPKALAFAAILVAGWLIAKAVRTIVDRVLERIGFDRMVERGGIKRALARSRYDASDFVAKLAYFGVWLLTLYLAFGVWGPNPISDLIGRIIAWLPLAFVAIVIVVVAAAIARAVKDIIGSALGGLSYGRILANVASVFILGLGVIAALNQIGIATTVTTPVLIAVLATVGGILVVGVGGGLIRPMQSRWETWLSRAEQESRTIAEHARAYRAARLDMEQQLRTPTPPPPSSAPPPTAPDGPAGAEPSSPPATPPPVAPVTLSPAAPSTPEPAAPVTPESAPATPPSGTDAEETVSFPRPDPEETVSFPRSDPESTVVIRRPDAEPTVAFPRQDAEATTRIPPLNPTPTGPAPSDSAPTEPTPVVPSPRQDPDATVQIRPPSDPTR